MTEAKIAKLAEINNDMAPDLRHGTVAVIITIELFKQCLLSAEAKGLNVPYHLHQELSRISAILQGGKQ